VLLAARSKSVARLMCGRVVARILACAVGFSGLSVWAAEPPEKVFELRIVGGSLPTEQRVILVTKGERVRWRITSDAPGQLHAHAYHLEANVVPGEPSELVFKAFATGRFRIEWHPASAKPALPGAHHAPPLATLEVHPK
jgi:hypothetical protein